MNILIIADLHIGKTESFRQKGLAIPGGTTSSDLNHLNELISQTNPKELLILGDFIHAKSGITEKTLSYFSEWRNNLKQLTIKIIPGNHDRKSQNLFSELDIEYTDKLYTIQSLVFNHEPVFIKNKYVLSGHIHPAVRLSGPGREREKLPCFYFTKNYGVIPSFGSFTGTYVINPKPLDRVFVIAGNDVVEVKHTL